LPLAELPKGKAELFTGRILVPYHSEVLLYDGTTLVRFMMYDPVKLPSYTGPYNIPIIEAGYADREGFQWVKNNLEKAMELARRCDETRKHASILTSIISLTPLNTSVRDHLRNPFVRPLETGDVISSAEEYLAHPDEWRQAWSKLEVEQLMEARGRWIIYTHLNGALAVTMEGLCKLAGDRDFSVVMALRFIVNGSEPKTEPPNEEEKKEAMRILSRRKPDIAMLLG